MALTMIAVGVASPKLHGQATRQTSTASRAPRAHAPPQLPARASTSLGFIEKPLVAGVAAAAHEKMNGAKTLQKTKAEAEAAKTTQVNFPATASTMRCTGGLFAFHRRVERGRKRRVERSSRRRSGSIVERQHHPAAVYLLPTRSSTLRSSQALEWKRLPTREGIRFKGPADSR